MTLIHDQKICHTSELISQVTTIPKLTASLCQVRDSREATEYTYGTVYRLPVGPPPCNEIRTGSRCDFDKQH